MVYLPEPAIEALRDHLATRPLAMPSARVFTRPDGSELRAHHVHTAWQNARAKRAGHSTQRAAMIYQHAAEDRDREVARRLSESAEARRLGTRRARRDQQGLT
jgi:integrase